ncbi:desmethylxanthohumol 6'-O-methyltransferase-like [Tripterygium wilfordii]|uniref:desmethylxanthohumol 6'-O-methyltransferase-like n=1 Tax=Tripterygium wilfordii TaxID=458696 RepID=UPI0018F8160C|nr:desmethylxanthohumol 6'-O-methyltransferase-like [Tripterygium wilfordii]
MGSIEEETLLLRGQQQVWQLMFGFADSMALKCAIQLRIPDIIYSHGAPISLSQIASGIDSPSPDMGYLDRIMRYLVRKNIFSSHQSSDGGETLFGLTDTSRWLLHDSDLSLNSMVIMQNHPWLLAPWHCFAQCVKDGGIAFKKAHGCEVWDFASQNPEFNNLSNDAMACTNKAIMKAFFLGYKDGLSSSTVQTLVDVGGGTGAVLAEIVKVYPHIKGINFDLPLVVATAPEYVGISHVGGDMFEAIPNADEVFMKWVLHDWRDEDCVKILRNCRKVIPEKTGKLVLVEVVVDEDENENESFGNTGFVFDLLMIAHASGGKERTELEWKKLLKEGGFPRYKIIKIPAITSIIEAYPE